MGLFSGLLGNAGEVDIADVEQELANIMADGEKPEQVFKLIRDLIVFTNRRLILIDKQGMTGSKKNICRSRIAQLCVLLRKPKVILTWNQI